MQGFAGVRGARRRDPLAQRPVGGGAMKLKGLGRGLDALLDRDGDAAPPPDHQATLRIDQLQRGRYQPRTKMDDDSLQELAASIRKQGLMQPILVRPVDGGRHGTIAGERRWARPKTRGPGG